MLGGVGFGLTMIHRCMVSVYNFGCIILVNNPAQTEDEPDADAR